MIIYWKDIEVSQATGNTGQECSRASENDFDSEMETLRSLSSILPLSSVSASFWLTLYDSLLTDRTLVPQFMRLKNGNLPVLGLETNMTAKGPLLDHVSMGIDGFGFGCVCFVGCGQEFPAKVELFCPAQILQKCLLNGF